MLVLFVIGQEQGGFSGGFPAGGFQGSGGFGGMDLNDILGDLMRGFGNQERGRRMKVCCKYGKKSSCLQYTLACFQPLD